MFKEKITSFISFFALIAFMWDCDYLVFALLAYFVLIYNVAMILIKSQSSRNSNKELKINLVYLALTSCANVLAGIFFYRNTLESCSIFWKLSIPTFIITIVTLLILNRKFNLLEINKSFVFFLSLFFLSFITTAGVYANKYIVVEKKVNIETIVISKEIIKGRRNKITHIIRFQNLNNKITKLEVSKRFYESIVEFDKINFVTNKGILGCHYILQINNGKNVVEKRISPF
jgi:hypothetical protein